MDRIFLANQLITMFCARTLSALGYGPEDEDVIKIFYAMFRSSCKEAGIDPLETAKKLNDVMDKPE